MAASSVIIVAGGSGKRMGGDVKKEFLKIEGVPVLFRAIKPFMETSLFNSVVIAVNGSLVEKTHEILNPFLTPEEREMIRCIPGGSTRRESVFKGLQALREQSPDVVLIHDGARPWITKEVIETVYNKALEKGAAIPVVPSVNALKKIDAEGKIIESIDRETVVGAQTPRGLTLTQFFPLTYWRTGAEGIFPTTPRFFPSSLRRYTPFRGIFTTGR